MYPEAGSGGGDDDGFVQFTIQPQANLATGTAINQQASVVFDINPPLATNTVTNTIVAVVTPDNASTKRLRTDDAEPREKISTLLSGHYSDVDQGSQAGNRGDRYDRRRDVAVFQWQRLAQYRGGHDDERGRQAGSCMSALPAHGAGELRHGAVVLCCLGRQPASAGHYANAGSVGGGAPFSTNAGVLTVNVIPLNHAPTWTGAAAAFTPVVPGQTPEESVASVFGPFFKDADGNNAGIAITGATATANGTWAYSTDDGASWTSFGSAATTFNAPSATNALLLAGTDLIRFVPKSGFLGAATLTADAWDGTQGAAALFGATTGYHITATGGATAFSTTALTATLHVNRAPTLTTTSITPFSVITEGGDQGAAVTGITSCTASARADAIGEAIVGDSGTGGSGTGTWQYQLAGSTMWTPMPAVSETSAFLLPSTASFRFMSASNGHGTATLTFRAWDGTAGTADKSFANADNGGATASST